VGHTVHRITVEGSATVPGPLRRVDVHVWYPADHRGFDDRQLTEYSSALYRRPLPPPWLSLSWTVDAQVAREDAPIDPHGKPFPVIVFSHGSVNDPIDYAHTLERIARAGFVVAAPSHVNNTQDAVRIDFANAQTGARIPCNDGLPGPCSRGNIPVSIADRVRDISAVLDELPEWLGDRADVERAGVMGHSRGTVSALAAAGGGAGDAFPAEPRVDAVMGMAIGNAAVTGLANLQGVIAPTLLVAAALDGTSPQPVSESAFETIRSTEKAFVSLPDGVHRSFDSTYCDQVQAAGRFAQVVDEDGRFLGLNERAILDLHTVRGIVNHPTSGVATQYCSQAAFTQPVDVRSLVATLTTIPFPASVPTTGLETDEVELGMTELAVTFFGTVLKRTGNDGPHFTRFLAPKWLEKHVLMVGCAEAVTGADAILPPGQEEDCGD
jgi:predicted dienelactone hydrolase